METTVSIPDGHPPIKGFKKLLIIGHRAEGRRPTLSEALFGEQDKRARDRFVARAGDDRYHGAPGGSVW